MKPISFLIIALLLLPALLLADDTPFAIQGDQAITQDDMDAAFAEIPEIHRYAFIRDGERVNLLVQKLLRARQIAAAARAEGFDQDPLVIDRLALKQEEELAKMWIAQVVENAPEADYEAMAEEYFLANPDEFQSEERLDVSHILISTETRPDEAALELVSELEIRLAEDPAQFDDLVMEYSEDPAKATNAGRYPEMKKGEMVAPFEAAAFALEQPGQISAPVQTTYGYHILRLNKRTPPGLLPFDAVKEQLIEGTRNKYLADYRKRYIAEVTTGTIEIPEGAVETMLKRYFGEDLELAPTFEER